MLHDSTLGLHSGTGHHETVLKGWKILGLDGLYILHDNLECLDTNRRQRQRESEGWIDREEVHTRDILHEFRQRNEGGISDQWHQ